MPTAGTRDDLDPRAQERALIQRCVTGDEDAWRTLYDRHFPSVERLVRSIGVADSEADDLCQEIFLIVHRNLKRFRGDAQLGTWLYRLAAREAIRFAKRRRLRRAFAEIFARERAPLVLPVDATESAAGRRHLLGQLLARLSPERRLALVLFEVEGLSVAEIATIADCKENTVWTRLHRARGDLEKILGEEAA